MRAQNLANASQVRALLKSGTDTCVEKAEQKMILMEGVCVF